MPYRISKADINHIAEILPDAYVLGENGETIELVVQGAVDPQTALPVAVAINEDNIDEYRKNKRRELLEEVRQVQAVKTNVKKRVLSAIVNNAIRSMH